MTRYLTFDTEQGPVDVDVPDWAEWRAQDFSGTWCFFAKEPCVRSGVWLRANGSKWAIVCHGIPPKHPELECYAIVRE